MTNGYAYNRWQNRVSQTDWQYSALINLQLESEAPDLVELATLNKGFPYIMTGMVETGVAPHYTELAAELGCGGDDGARSA